MQHSPEVLVLINSIVAGVPTNGQADSPIWT